MDQTTLMVRIFAITLQISFRSKKVIKLVTKSFARTKKVPKNAPVTFLILALPVNLLHKTS
jgi:hypothetical protein